MNNAMTKLKPRQFFKEVKNDERDRIEFNDIVNYCPDLANRVIILRSRVKDLRFKFREDANWALKQFNRVTQMTIFVALFGVILGTCISIWKPEMGIAGVTSLALGAIIGVAGAASKAFGWHKRYHAMFRAQWAMASLEVQIDSFVYNLAASVKGNTPLSEKQLGALEESMSSWLAEFDSILRTFGETYGAAISPIDIKTKS